MATGFITESEKDMILNYLETTKEGDLTVLGLMAGARSITGFVLSLLQAANVQRDFKREWHGASNINPDHSTLRPDEEGAFAFNNQKRRMIRRRKASEYREKANRCGVTYHSYRK